MASIASRSYSDEAVSYKQVILIFFLVQFACWSLLELLEHKMGMQPAIRRRSSFSRMAQQNTSNTSDRNHYAMTQRRLTKTLDHKGRFRIQTRGAIYLIKTLWQLTGFIYYIVEFIIDSEWFIDHFYYLNEKTVLVQKMQNVCALVIAYYCWEMATNRYAKLQKSIAIHHWFSCIAAITIIYFDRFSPLISWYAFIGLFSAGIPINISLCLRASCKQYKKMNKYIQVSLKFAGYWYLTHLIILLLGSCVIITNQWISGYYRNNPLRIIIFIITLFWMIAFFYSDIITLRALFELSHQNYSILSQNKHKKNKLSKSATTMKNRVKPTGNTKKATNSNHDPDSYIYEAYPISGTMNDNNNDNINVLPAKLFDATTTDTEFTTVPTDFSQYRAETDDYAQKLYLDGVVNTDRNLNGIPSALSPVSMHQFSMASYLSNNSVQFVPVLKNEHNVTETPYSADLGNMNLKLTMDDIEANTIDEEVDIDLPSKMNMDVVSDSHLKMVDKIVNSPINIPAIDTNYSPSNKKSPSSMDTPIPSPPSPPSPPMVSPLNNYNNSDDSVLQNECSDTQQLEEIYNDIIGDTDDINKTENNISSKHSNSRKNKQMLESDSFNDVHIGIGCDTDLFTLESDREINIPEFINKENKSDPSPIIQVTAPKNNNNNKINWNEVQTRTKSQSFNEGKSSKLKLKSPQNPTHLSVNVVRLKKGNYSHHDDVNDAKLHDTKSNIFDRLRSDITVKKEILPSQIKEMESNLPKNCEFGVFAMTDKKSGIQQQVVLVKYLKNNNNDNKEVILYDDDDRDTIVDVVVNNNNNNNNNDIPDILENNESESIQTKFLKKLVCTVNDIFSPSERIDDGIYLDFDDDHDYYDQNGAVYND